MPDPSLTERPKVAQNENHDPDCALTESADLFLSTKCTRITTTSTHFDETTHKYLVRSRKRIFKTKTLFGQSESWFASVNTPSSETCSRAKHI